MKKHLPAHVRARTFKCVHAHAHTCPYLRDQLMNNFNYY